MRFPTPAMPTPPSPSPKTPPPENGNLLAMFKTIFDSTLVGIGFLQGQRLVRCNPSFERIFGYPPGELDQRDIDCLLPPGQHFDPTDRLLTEPLPQREATAVPETPSPQSGQFEEDMLMRRKSGEVFWCRFSGAVHSGDNAMTTTILLAQDIDQSKRAKLFLESTREELEQRVAERTANLERANRMLQSEMQKRRRVEERHMAQQAEFARLARINTAGEMVTTLAHELGQPLASMLNYVHGCLLRMESAETKPADLREGLTLALRSAEHAGEILRRVRQFLNKQPPERHTQDIRQLAEDVAAFLDAEARRQSITLRLRLPRHPLIGWLNRVEIEQVIVNLVKNAFEAISGRNEGSRIVEISCLETARHSILIGIADSGPGIPPTVGDAIFNPFFTTRSTGIGFGLAICRTLVESHGGELRLGQSWLGGALFEVELPFKEH